jgi:hypothetical protein
MGAPLLAHPSRMQCWASVEDAHDFDLAEMHDYQSTISSEPPNLAGNALK